MSTTEQTLPQAASVPSHASPEKSETPSPELVAARLAQFERLQALLAKGNSTSGRNGRPWREWINDHEE